MQSNHNNEEISTPLPDLIFLSFSFTYAAEALPSKSFFKIFSIKYCAPGEILALFTGKSISPVDISLNSYLSSPPLNGNLPQSITNNNTPAAQISTPLP